MIGYGMRYGIGYGVKQTRYKRSPIYDSLIIYDSLLDAMRLLMRSIR